MAIPSSSMSAASAAAAKKKKRRVLVRKKRTLDPGLTITYKNSEILKRFVTDRGKIIPRRISGATQEQQRQIALGVKQARFLALIPYGTSHEMERGFAGEMQNVAQSFLTTPHRSASKRKPDDMEEMDHEDDIEEGEE